MNRVLPSLFFGILSMEDETLYYQAKQKLIHEFGEIFYESNSIAVSLQDTSPFAKEKISYYTKILSFKQKMNREELPERFLKTKKIEKKVNGKLGKNKIEVGYINLHNVVLANSQDDFQRTYLFHGVFGEVIYHYQSSKFFPLETTPKFFQSRDVLYFFTTLRDGFELNSKKT